MHRRPRANAARRLVLSLWVLCALTPALAAAETELVERQFEESARLIRNPDCGWIAYNYEDSYELCRRRAGGKEPFMLASVVYTRHPRRAWQGPTGRFEESAPVRLLDDWIKHQRHVAFRIYANSMNHLPDRLRPEVSAIAPAKRGILYSDPEYIEDHRRLVEYLGGRFGDSPYLAFVDIGGVGNTGGEWHFAPLSLYREAGLHGDTMHDLVEVFVKMYRRAFPNTRLFIGYDCIKHAGHRSADVIDILRENDVGVRDDGLGGWPYPKPFPPLDAWPLPLLWRRMPVMFEGGGEGGGVYGWGLQGKDREKVLRWAFDRAHPSYINLGGAETNSARACRELAPLLLTHGRKLGYRFALLHASCPRELGVAQQATIRMRWANRGNAPCYADRELEVAFCNIDGSTAAAVKARPEPTTTEWEPNQELDVELSLTVPADLEPGEYLLKLRMLLGDPRAPDTAVDVATADPDEKGRYTLGTVEVSD